MPTKPKSRKGYVAASAGKGALSGAAKGAAIGSVVPGVGTVAGGAIGGIVGGLKGFFSGRSKAKAADEKMAAQESKLNLGEEARVNRFNAGQSLLQGLQGKGFTNISPEAAAAIGAKRDLSGLVEDPLAGGGSAALGEGLQEIEDYGSQYGINQDGGSGYLDGLGMSPGQAGVPMQETPGVPDLRSRVGEFNTGIDYDLDPYAGRYGRGVAFGD